MIYLQNDTKFLDGSLFVEKQNSGKLKSSVEHIEYQILGLGKFEQANIHAVL